VQLLSLPDSKISWIAGLFYLDSEAVIAPLELRGAAQAGVGGFLHRFARMDTTSYAAYAQMTAPIGAKTNITGGVRYTRDERHLLSRDVLGTGATVNPLNTGKTFEKPTWRLAIDRKLTSDTLIYASYSRGFKSGVYNLFAPHVDPVNPEVPD
jgi:iron complex outermembrane receptor protein